MGLRPLPHVIVFIWKRNFFFTDTASVHTYPMKTINENGTFRKRSPEWNFLKTLFWRVRVDRRKRSFSKTLRSHYQFQSTLHNIRNLFKMAVELSFNTYASSMRSQVSYRSQIDSSYTCGRTKTKRKYYEWTRIFLKTDKKSCVFKRIRILLLTHQSLNSSVLSS